MWSKVSKEQRPIISADGISGVPYLKLFPVLYRQFELCGDGSMHKGWDALTERESYKRMKMNN